MLALVYRVIDIVQQLEYQKKNPPKIIKMSRDPGIASDWENENPWQFDETLIDPTLTECWVVYGPCLPKVNGTYEYQKDYSKATAEKFCQLVNNLSADGWKNAQAQMRQALGIKQ